MKTSSGWSLVERECGKPKFTWSHGYDVSVDREEEKGEYLLLLSKVYR